jgi:general secretion pathway protein A
VTNQNPEWLSGLQEASAGAALSGSSGSLTYEPFYGLSEKPFSLSADPRFLFKSSTHAPAFDALFAGIRRREGLIVLTGEIGTGKTTLCRSVLKHLDRRTFAAFVPDPFVSREDLLKMLLVDFGAISITDLKRGRLMGASRLDLSYLLYDFLDSLVPLQAFAVLVIDEAQNLPFPLLEEIRILSDLERREKLLQIVLVGQPELRSSLKLTQMRQVEQRVSVRCELAALDTEAVAGYVNHRLAVASDGKSRAEFTPSSLEAVHQGSSGVPRLINRICDRALQRAYLSRTYRIDPGLVWDAIDDLGLSRPSGVDGGATAETVRQPSEVPPTPKPSAISPVIEELPDMLSEFAAEADLFGDRDQSSARWHRWATVALATFLATCAFGGSTWYLHAQSVSSDAVRAIMPALPPRPSLNLAVTRRILLDATLVPPSSARPAAPVASSVPAEGNTYVIQVATFESRVRAERLVEELKLSGYRARAVELNLDSTRGRVLQVIIDGYSSAIEVQRDLQWIRQLPGYSDARLIDGRF